MTTPSNPDDLALIQELYQTIALKDSSLKMLHHTISLSKDSEALLQKKLDNTITTQKIVQEETHIITALLKTKIKELQDILYLN